MTRNLLWSSFLLLFAAYTFAQTTKTTTTNSLGDANKTAVEKFGMAIVKSYFDHNCAYLNDRLATQIKSFENGQTLTIDAALKAEMCKPANSPLRTDITVSMAIYTQNYKKAEVLTLAELNAKYPGIEQNLGLLAGDYFFDGSQMIDDFKGTRVFNAGDMARFVVRKINGEWKIIAI